MYKNLTEYLSLLEGRGELVRITASVNPVEEIAEIADRISKSPGGGPALLFENTGTGFPVAINLFGSERRMALALGAESLDDIPARIDNFAAGLLSPKGTFSEKLAAAALLGRASRWFPRKTKGRGECQQVAYLGEQASLAMLPVLKCWEHDGGRFLTLPLVHTINPVTGVRNVGMYRMQLFGEHEAGMHWHLHKTGARHYEEYKRLFKDRGGRMPVSVCLGGDPAYTYSATAPLPDGIDEYLLAGFLRGKPVRLVKCLTNELYVPADCDFVIEGYIDTAEEKVLEGPFGDHTGFYSLEDLYPLLRVTAITHRRGAVYPATVVGVPPQEDYYIAQATEKIFLAPIKLALQPEVEDIFMPGAGVAHNLAIVNIRRSYPGQAAKVASALWGAGQMMFNKYMVVCDTGGDIRRPEILAPLLRGADMHSAVIRGSGPLDILDHATATPGMGGKLALDLTCTEPFAQMVAVPDDIMLCGGVESCDLSLAAQWGIIAIYATAGSPVDIPAFLSRNCLAGIKIAVVIDCSPITLTPYELLWLAAANSDPARDVSLAEVTSGGEMFTEIDDKQARGSAENGRSGVKNARGGTLIVDARTKLPGGEDNPARFPNVVTSSQAVIELVDSRWKEYGIGTIDKQYGNGPDKSGKQSGQKNGNGSGKSAGGGLEESGRDEDNKNDKRHGMDSLGRDESGAIPGSPSRRYRSLLRSGKAEI